MQLVLHTGKLILGILKPILRPHKFITMVPWSRFKLAFITNRLTRKADLKINKISPLGLYILRELKSSLDVI